MGREKSASWVAWAAFGLGVAAGVRFASRRRKDYDFVGKTALVTGGSRGLGLLIARQLAAQGARVALAARDPAELERAANEFEQRGQEVLVVPCDLTRPEEAGRLVMAITDRWGPIDVLVNNAGVIQAAPMEEMTLDDFRESMDLHFWAAVYLVNAVLPEMRRRGGRIVNISSIGGKVSVPHLLPYCSSKFALVGFSEGLRSELAKDGIAVTTVCPGLMRTGSPRNAFFKGQHQAEYAWFSVMDSLPLASIDGDRAARRIVAACARGDAELMVSLPGRAAATFHGVFPGLTADMLGWFNRILPRPGGIGRQRASGHQSQSRWSPSLLTRLTEQAAARNNELN
jgi:NAD(P)-dependent dehydrogenase (short-subunit alcohol dehydrogenase family)